MDDLGVHADRRIEQDGEVRGGTDALDRIVAFRIPYIEHRWRAGQMTAYRKSPDSHPFGIDPPVSSLGPRSYEWPRVRHLPESNGIGSESDT